MKAKKAVIIILSVILAITLAYGTVAMITLTSEYDGGGGGFGAFTDSLARLFTDPFSLTFKKTAYKLFGAVLEKGVAAGYDGYLFPTKTDDFDYVSDIAGKMRYDSETKEKFLSSLETRRDALALDGCEFFVYVIPNSQTVLRDKLKSNNKDGVTAAQDLEAYLRENGFENFRLLDGILTDKEYETYDNTENSINGYGAYVVYGEIAGNMPEQITRRSYRLTLDEDDISVSYTDGGSLAKEAGIEKLLKNKSVTYKTDKFAQTYTSKLSGNLTVCRLVDEYDGFIGRSELLIQIPDDERTLFMPLFSASYTDTVYSNSLSYSNNANSIIKPEVDICILREDKLISLLDEADIRSYETHLKNAGKGGVTESPDVRAVSYKKSGSAVVAGICEDGAGITVISDKGEATVVCRDGLFIAELPADKGAELKICAEVGGKERSDTVKCTVPLTVTSEENVFAGNFSMLYYGETVDDYTGTNLLKPERIEATKKRFETLTDKIREASGKDTKIIILAAPDPLSVYPDAASEKHYKRKADTTQLDQFKDALSGFDGVAFLDIRDVMRQNTDIDKLYYQTDTHWTEVGAYFGYRAITEEVSKDYPFVSPLSLNAFELTEKSVGSGDLSSFAGLTGLYENVRFLKPAFKSKATGIADKPDTIDRSLYAGELESRVDDDKLPSAYMIRDSYSANLFPHICEHFSYLYAQRMWEYEPDYEKIAVIKPDYVICVICERNFDMWR